MTGIKATEEGLYDERGHDILCNKSNKYHSFLFYFHYTFFTYVTVMEVKKLIMIIFISSLHTVCISNSIQERI